MKNEKININLSTSFLGRNFIFYDEIDSTQSQIWRLIKNNHIHNGTVVMSDIQTEGKGTKGRRWYTDEPQNIAFSFFLQTDCNIEKLDGVTIEIAQILVNLIKEKYRIQLDIKPPNDITYNNKKIGGILTESKMQSGVVRFLVVGIGINTVEMSFNEEIKDRATSIKKEFGIEIDRMEIIVNFCDEFEKTIKRRINSENRLFIPGTGNTNCGYGI